MTAPAARFYFAPTSTWTTPDADIVWEEITDYALLNAGVSVNRGRGSELDDYRAGTCSFTLDNSDRRFDPTHAAGPYYGDLLPGVPVKLEAVAAVELLTELGEPILTESGEALTVDETFPVFRGFAEGWPQDYDVSNRSAVVNIDATDGFAKLATAGTPSSVYALQVASDAPKAWWRLSESAGDSLADSANDYDGSYSSAATQGSTRHPGPYETVSAMEFTPEAYAVVGDSAARITAEPLGIEAVVRIDDAGGVAGPSGTTSIVTEQQISSSDRGFLLQIETFGGLPSFVTFTNTRSFPADIDLRDGLTHHLFISKIAGTVAAYLDGVEVTLDIPGSYSAPAGNSIRIGADGGSSTAIPGVVADVAIYNTAIDAAAVAAHAEALFAPWDGDTTGERIARILALGWPSDLTDIATGFTVLGPATLGKNQLRLLQGYEAAEQGRFFIARDGKATFLDRYYTQLVTEGSTSQATFSDAECSALSFDYDDRLVYNRVRASRVGGGDIEVYDQISINTYGEQVDTSLNNIQVSTDAAVRGAAELRLDRYKDPQLRVRPVELKLHGLSGVKQADILDLELSHRVTAERTPQAVGSAITQETIVEGISHRIAGAAWSTTFTLSPVDTAEYALWGSTNWGDTAGWGY